MSFFYYLLPYKSDEKERDGHEVRFTSIYSSLLMVSFALINIDRITRDIIASDKENVQNLFRRNEWRRTQ
jgi:hypothetical protein